MKKLIWLCLFFPLSVLSNPAAIKSGIAGTVTDIHGVALPAGLKVRILVHWDASGADIGLKSNVGIASDVSVDTDDRGAFATELPPGFYDVFVSAFSFSPTCRKIRVRPGEVVTFNPRLNVDPLVTRELADRPF